GAGGDAPPRGPPLPRASVAREGPRTAPLRRSVAPPAAGAIAHDVAGLELDRRLRREARLRAITDEDVLGGAPVLAAEGACGAAHGAVGEHGERRRAIEEVVLAQTEAAPEPAGAVGVLDQRKTGDAHPVVEL